MQPQRADSLVLALRNAAREMVDRRSISDLEYVLTQIVAVAVDTVPGVDAGGITMTENGHITSRSPTNDDIRKLDDLQAEMHEGPCITAVEYPPDDGVVLAQDLTGPPDTDRWPHFAPQAVAHGYQSLLSTQLSTNGGTRAALNLYSRAANSEPSTRIAAAALPVPRVRRSSVSQRRNRPAASERRSGESGLPAASGANASVSILASRPRSSTS